MEKGLDSHQKKLIKSLCKPTKHSAKLDAVSRFYMCCQISLWITTRVGFNTLLHQFWIRKPDILKEVVFLLFCIY